MYNSLVEKWFQFNKTFLTESKGAYSISIAVFKYFKTSVQWEECSIICVCGSDADTL